MKFTVGNNVLVINTRKTHKISTCYNHDSYPSSCSSYTLDNGTQYWEFELKPAAYGVSVLIMKNNKILSVARRNDPNMYGLVGGKREIFETEEEAATRECLEETGIKIFNLKEINRRDVGPDEAMTFSCNWKGTPSTQEGEPECSWQDPEVLMQGIFGEYNTNLFKKIGLKE